MELELYPSTTDKESAKSCPHEAISQPGNTIILAAMKLCTCKLPINGVFDDIQISSLLVLY
jgi:hypothetical protein